MPLLQKNILRVGTRFGANGEIPITPQRLLHWKKQHARLKANGNKVPSRYDHDLAHVDALSHEDFDKELNAGDTIAELLDINIAPDGKSAEFIFNVPKQKDYELALDNIIGVSPVIADQWEDGLGNKYTDVIVHADFVNHAVDCLQGDFRPVTALSLGVTKKFTRVFLSRGITAMADNTAAPDGLEDLDIDSETDLSESPDDVTDDGAMLSEVMGLLAARNIIVPDDTTPEDFLSHLRTALMTANAHTEEDSDPTEPAGDENGGNVDMQMPPAMMSLTKHPMYLLSQNQYRSDLSRRLKECVRTGRCEPHVAKQMEKSIGVTTMSLAPTGKVKKSVAEIRLGDLEAREAGSAWPSEVRTSLMSLNHVEIPTNMTEMTDAQAEAITDRIFKVKKK